MDLSIIIPTYNSLRYLAKIKRDLATFIVAENVEVIIVDDASTDGTQEALQQAFDGMANVTLELKQENLGQSDSRYRGLQQATGTYIYFMDSDDHLEEGFAKKILPAVREHPADIIFFDYMARMKRVTIGKHSGTITREDALDTVLELNGKRSSAGYLWNKIFRRSLIDGMTFKDTLFEDLDFCVRAVLKANAFLYVKEVGYHYVFHFKSSFNGTFLSHCDKLVNDRIDVQEGVIGQLVAHHDELDFSHLKKPLMSYNLNIVGWLLMISLGRVKDKTVIQRVYNFHQAHQPDFKAFRSWGISVLFKWHGIKDKSKLKNDYQA